MLSMMSFDRDFLLYLQSIRTPVMDNIMKFITKFGDAGLFWIGLAVILLITKKFRKTGLGMLIALTIGAIITNVILKNWIARPRPYVTIDDLICIIGPQKDFSFPSGHSTASIAASLSMFLTMPKRYGIPALIFGLLICFSRLYVGVHYPTDVIAGIMIGAASAVVSLFIVKKVTAARSK
jgi:undecaprenyl-diphosphatase